MTARRNVRRAGPAARGGRTAVAALALAGFAALAGCGDQQAGGSSVSSSASSGSSGSSPSGAATAAPAEGSLTVVLDDGGGGQRTWELSCSPDGTVTGDHPDAANACAAIAAAKDAWAPVPPDTACTMVYGGPQVATVRGTWGGVDVDARFQRTDGCEIARWDRIAPLLQPGTRTGGASGAV